LFPNRRFSSQKRNRNSQTGDASKFFPKRVLFAQACLFRRQGLKKQRMCRNSCFRIEKAIIIIIIIIIIITSAPA
jgi:hypothetical protein